MSQEITWKRHVGGARKAHKFEGASEEPFCGSQAARGTPFVPVTELGPHDVPWGNVCDKCLAGRRGRRDRPVVLVPELETFIAAGRADRR